MDKFIMTWRPVLWGIETCDSYSHAKGPIEKLYFKNGLVWFGLGYVCEAHME